MVNRARMIKFTEAEVISTYEVEQSAFAASKKLGIGHNTVLRILAKHGIQSVGLKLYRENARRFSDDVTKAIATEYAAGALIADLEKKYGGSHYTITRAIKSNGVALRDNPAPPIRPGEPEKIIALRDQGLTYAKIALALGRTPKVVAKVLQDNGDETGKARGIKHGAWSGGKHVNGAGYVEVLVDADDPMASMRTLSNYVLEHRLVMARHLGRPLTARETVHHIDNDKLNNSIENLQLRQGRHGKHVVMRCLECGSHNIGFAPIKDNP
jgi:hypothetical protein